MEQLNVSPSDLWEEIGSIEPDDLPHVLINLFTSYEKMLQQDPDSQEAKEFFQKLAKAISQTSECNLNRR